MLSSVLLPSAFLSGLVGQFFRQFAITISVSMLISAINAMTMTPALAVLFFANRKPGKHGEDKEALPWWSFGLFGGLITVWLLTPILGPSLGLTTGEGHGEAAPRRPAAPAWRSWERPWSSPSPAYWPAACWGGSSPAP